MNLELFRTFLAVLEQGGVRRAAVALHRSQPAVSARLQELERAVGAQVFEQVGRRLELTDAGRVLAAEAPLLLRAAAELVDQVQEAATADRGRLRLATIDAASIYVLPALYLEYRTAHPQVQLFVQVVDSRHVLALVRAREADIGVVALPASHPELDIEAIFEEELVCVAAPTHPLASGAACALRDVSAHPLVLYARGSTTRAMLDAVFEAHGLAPHVAMEAASPEAMKRLAEAGIGITIIPEALVRDDVAAGRLRQLTVPDARFARRLGIVVRRGRTLSAHARRFLALLHERHLAPPGGLESGAGPVRMDGPRLVEPAPPRAAARVVSSDTTPSRRSSSPAPRPPAGNRRRSRRSD